MKKFLLLPLFAALTLASCDATVDGGDNNDANDSAENAMQTGAENAGDNIEAGAERAGDKIEAGAENAGSTIEATGEKMDGDSLVRPVR